MANIVDAEEPDDADDKRYYAIRMMPRAILDLQQARLYVEAVSGEDAADEWEEGIEEMITSLRTMPYRSVIPERHHFSYEVRQVTYQRRGSSYRHRVLHIIREQSLDGPVVNVIHIRHSSQDEITRWEVAVIEQQMEITDPIVEDSVE